MCFANRWLGSKIAGDLGCLDGVDLALVVVHDPPNADIDISFLSNKVRVITWTDFLTTLVDHPTLYDAGVSALFGYIIPDNVVSTFKDGIVNLHPSLLPYGRGKHPATWAIWEQSPYGASAHRVTSKIDGGPLLSQVRLPILAHDTSESLYLRGLGALWDIYSKDVRSWVQGRSTNWEEQASGGSVHSQADLQALQNCARDSVMPMRDHVRLLRALSMGPGSGLALSIAEQEILVNVIITPKWALCESEES